MKDLTLTCCKMEAAGGTIILTSLHFQSWQYNTEAEHIFICSFPTSIKEKKNFNSLGSSRKVPEKRCGLC